MCECVKQVNEKLAESGHQLSMGFRFNVQANEVTAHLLLKTERATLPATKKRSACPSVPVRFCPFCGEKT